jgi:hypothetical protein
VRVGDAEGGRGGGGGSSADSNDDGGGGGVGVGVGEEKLAPWARETTHVTLEEMERKARKAAKLLSKRDEEDARRRAEQAQKVLNDLAPKVGGSLFEWVRGVFWGGSVGKVGVH